MAQVPQELDLTSKILRSFDGPMTRELLLEPSKHGLGMTPNSLRADSTATAVCGYCSTGCGLRLHLQDGKALGLTPETNYPVNLGMACPKGWEALRVLDSEQRATRPLIRNSDGVLSPGSWDDALKEFCERFQGIQAKHGNDSIAFLSTGQIACEEMAFLGALAKFGMGMQHGDGNTRQCMATSVVAYKQSFGFDAPPYTYADFELSDCLVFIGANPCIAHPIMWERVLRNSNQPEILVLDPRKTETASAATQHLQLQPKSDLVLLYGITRHLIETGQIDQQFVKENTSGFDELREAMQPFTLAYASLRSGLPEENIAKAADTIGSASAASLWWTMGVNQSYEGVRTAQAIINIALLTGNIGRPGTGANSITGQCNAMGSRLWSNTTNLFGHHDFASEEDRQKVARLLGFDASCIPDQGSWSYDQILDGVRAGKIRGLWVIATNPAHSWIHQEDVREILSKLEFCVVQDMYATTETAEMADLVLPAAGWGEKDGTFINSERRYGLHRRVRQAPGEALADFQIFRAIAHYWGLGEMFQEWTDPEAVFRIMQRVSRGMPNDITGIDGYADIDRRGGIQWPWSEQNRDQEVAGGSGHESERRLFAGGKFYHSDGKAKFITAEPREMPEPPDDEYPFLLLSGRGTVSQWHTQTRTSQSPILRKLYPNDPILEIHPSDAAKYDLSQGDWLSIESRRGQAQARVSILPTLCPGQLFMPMHYECTNQLTLAHFDPYSRQPSYKDCAVQLVALSDNR